MEMSYLATSLLGVGVFLGHQFRSGRQHIHKQWPWLAFGFTVGVLASEYTRLRSARKCIQSPRKTTLPALSADEIAGLAYPSDAFPGARDVDSPYGSLRVYEWGPVDGDKVLFIHGISTPCIALGDVAQGLVQRGHRVMLFDLWGRGYSDTPQDLPQDERLFSSAILIALASSSLCWTGSSKFALVGYSLGGGISVNFTSFFPSLISYLILIAPSGLIRKDHISRSSKLLYSSGLLSENWVEYFVKKRLEGNPSAAVALKSKQTATNSTLAETGSLAHDSARVERSSALLKNRPEVLAREAVVSLMTLPPS